MIAKHDQKFIIYRNTAKNNCFGNGRNGIGGNQGGTTLLAIPVHEEINIWKTIQNCDIV